MFYLFIFHLTYAENFFFISFISNYQFLTAKGVERDQKKDGHKFEGWPYSWKNNRLLSLEIIRRRIR